MCRARGGSVKNAKRKVSITGFVSTSLAICSITGLCFVACEAIQLQNEKFALADIVFLRSRASRGRWIVLSLRIENGGLRHYPNVCFHYNP